jgi:hypothetical protein
MSYLSSLLLESGATRHSINGLQPPGQQIFLSCVQAQAVNTAQRV